MDKRIITELRQTNERRRVLSAQFDDNVKQQYEIEVLQSQTILKFTDTQYRTIAANLKELQKQQNQIWNQKRETETSIFHLIEALEKSPGFTLRKLGKSAAINTFAELLLELDKLLELEDLWDSCWNELNEYETLQKQSVMALSNEQLETIAATIEELSAKKDEANIALHETETRVFDTIDALLAQFDYL